MIGNSKELTKNKSLAVKAYQSIEEMIVTLKLPPGTVFSESDLGERIGIGRTPLREALQRLAAEHMIHILPRRGMQVTEINLTDFLALIETRAVLDQLLAEKAAKRANPEQRDELRALATAMVKAAEADQTAEFMRIDRLFDHIVSTASRNRFAAKACSPLHAHCRRFWYLHQSRGDLKRSAALHAALMNAIADGDETAAAQSSARLLAYLEAFTRSALDLI